ncbi:hypothetical protein LXA47_31285 [Massilia sp. P8910]|uniref:hypothetical protein n=1 Tax=Massilia antarctica TaxID=2765360 RepID=UPI001E633B01|nr:hypothetical protein [Massilia antarctica]MCE3608055.1 hypothetical protein [Massilia antarctica]
MHSLELIARIAPKGNRISGSVGKAHSVICESDIAGALAGVSHPIGSMLLRRKYGLDNPGELYRAWCKIVESEAAKQGWKSKKPETFKRLAIATMNEQLRMNPERIVEPTSHAERADELGMAQQSYSELWHPRFEHCVDMLARIEVDAVDDFVRRMRRR